MNEMTCREFDEVVHGFVRMELLDVILHEAVLEHAACCSECAERMAEAAALAEAAEAAGRSMQDQQTPARVEAAVLTAFRNHHRRAVWRRTFEWAAVGTAAAVLLLFVWLHIGRSGEQLQPLPSRDVSSKSREPMDAKLGTAFDRRQDAKQSAMPGQKVGDLAVTTLSVTNVPANDQDTETANVEVTDTSFSQDFVASDFVPVPYTAGVSADDPGMVVRMQLTRASLAQLGYPIAETASDDDLIRADVLVGMDGWPRGVKVLQSDLE